MKRIIFPALLLLILSALPGVAKSSARNRISNTTISSQAKPEKAQKPRKIENQAKSAVTTKAESTQTIAIWSYAELEKNIFAAKSDTTYVINFWATWCKPCVEELPEFERLTKETAGTKVKVVLLSLDFKKDRETKVLPFVRNKGIKLQVVLFSEKNQNEWIDRISPEWSGAIPVTVFVNTAKGIREFYEKQFSFTELSTIVQRINGDNK